MMKTIVNNIICLIIILLFTSNINGQVDVEMPFYFNRDVTERVFYRNDISSNNVFSISQDDYGMMWFGTLRGLNSYDGYSFVDYNNNIGVTNTKITDVQSIGDSLLIGTINGLLIFNLITRETQNYNHSPNDSLPHHLHNSINFISKPYNGKVIIGTDKGVMIFDTKLKKFFPFEVENLNVDFDIQYIDYLEEDSSWWAATSNGLLNYKSKKQSLHQYFSIEYSDGTLLDNYVNCVSCVDMEHVFIGTKKGLTVFNTTTNKFERINLEQKLHDDKKCDITVIIEYGKDGILIGTHGDGLFYYNYVTKEMYHASRFGNQMMSISDDHILDLFLDERGIVWIATYNGLNTLEFNVSKFYTYKYYDENTNNQSVWCFEEITPEEYLVGTDKGIMIFNKRNGSFQSFEEYYGLKDNILSTMCIYSFYYEDEKYLWIGTRHKGLYRFDIDTKHIISVFDYCDMPEYNNSLVRSIVRDKYDNYWIATNHGLSNVNIKKKTHNHYYTTDDENSLPSDDIFDFLYKDDILWITTGDGLSRYNYEEDNFKTYKIPDSLRVDGIVKNNCLHNITDGKNGKYYIGSYSCGVVTFYPDTKEFVLFNQKAGVSSPMVYSIVRDNDDNLWVSTNKGITKYNRNMKTFTKFDVSDGLQGNDFTLNASFMSSQGIMFFGGLNGFNMFNPKNIRAEFKEPRVIITSFNTPKDNKGLRICHGDTINLEFDQNSFTIEFSAINLKKINKAKYRFFLENYDNKWIERSTDKHFAEYHQIPAGTYVFKLIAANEANIWNEMPFEITIVINNIWYQTLQFKILVVLFAILLISVIIYGRVRYIREKAKRILMITELEKQMFKLKQKSLQLQMNPHILFNTLNSIQQFILTNDMDSAVRYLSSFSRLMRRILSNSNELYIPLFEELEAIRLYLELEMLRFKGRFKYNIDIKPDVDTRYIDIAPMLIQPYVENAIVHGLMFKDSGGYLKIELSYIKEGQLLCLVEDNGIGRMRAAEIKKESDINRKSFGMNITKERMALLNKFSDEEYYVEIEDLYDGEGKPSGTRVKIFINIKE